MKKINTYTKFELCVRLLDCVNSKEEFDYFIKRMKEISPLAFFYNYSTQGAFSCFIRGSCIINTGMKAAYRIERRWAKNGNRPN